MSSCFLNSGLFNLSSLLWTNWIQTHVPLLLVVLGDYEYMRLWCHVGIFIWFDVIINL